MSLESANPYTVLDAADIFLVTVTEFGFPIILEFAGLCIEGRVRCSSVEGHNRFYEVAMSNTMSEPSCNSNIAEPNCNEITFATKHYGSKILEDFDLREVQCLMLGLARLNATVKAEGKWAPEFPHPKYFSNIGDNDLLRNLSQLMHSDSFLKLADLREINEWCSRLRVDESKASSDPAFAIAFPSSFRDCLRHRSGHEVLLYRNDAGTLVSHRVDAPNPAEDLYTAWLDSVNQRPPKSKANKSLRLKRWRLAKILGSISEGRKPEVFNWVSDVTWKMEEHESTHGREQMPRALEYFFDDYVLFANEQMEFELLKM